MSNYNPYTKRQTMIAPDYEVYRYRSTYMNEVELHHHDFYEIYLLLRGRVEYIVENQLYRVRPGDWMLCSPLELHQARIARCVYGAPDQKAGAVGTLYDIHADGRLNHQFEVTGGVREEECVALLRDFFRARRKKPMSNLG